MIQSNEKQQKINLSCKKHDEQQIIIWCSQPDCKEGRLCCALCQNENKHGAHFQNVFEIDQLVPYFAEQQKKVFELKQFAQSSSEKFCKFFSQIMDEIEYLFYQFDPENIRSQESICDAIQLSFQFENLQQNIEKFFVKKLEEIQDYLGQFNKENQLNLKDAEKYCKLGDSLLKQNRLDEAKNFYQKSLHIKKTDFNAKIGIAQCLQKSHNYKEALELYKEVQNDDKNNYFISFQIAECLRNMWQDEEALAAYSQALDIHETTQGFFMQGVTLFNLNRMDEILQFYQRAKKLGIKDEWMKLFKILKFQMDENNDKAQELINQIGNDSDQQVHCRISIFKILSSLENKEENLKYANQILKIEPNNLQTLQIKFDILLEQQQYEEVILQYDQMQKINGKHESINKMKDKLYSKLSELDDYEQMDIFEQILLFNPKSITTQIMKCQFLLDKYKYKQALYTFAQILKLDWNEEILELKNQLLLKVSSEFQDDHKIFYDFYTKWLQINPSNVIVLEFMYHLLIKQKEFEEAIKFIQLILQFEPNNFMIQSKLCKCLIRVDKIKEAINIFNQLINQIHSPSKKMQKKNKKLFNEIIALCKNNNNREIITKLLKEDPENFVAQILEYILISQDEESEDDSKVGKGLESLEYIYDAFNQNYQNKLQLIQNFLDEEKEMSIRHRVIIMKAIKELFILTKKKEPNKLIKLIKKSLLKKIENKLSSNERLSILQCILKNEPDNLIALELKTILLFQRNSTRNKKQIIKNIEIILDQNPYFLNLVKIKCQYLLEKKKFGEAIELANSILSNKNLFIRIKIYFGFQDPLIKIIKMIEEFDHKSKFKELNKILQANQDNQIALKLMCLALLEKIDEQSKEKDEQSEVSKKKDESSDEEDEPSEENDELSKEKDELSEEKDELSEEKDEQSEKNDEQSEENDELSEEKDELNVSDCLTKIIKLSNRLNEITYYLMKDVGDIKKQIYKILMKNKNVNKTIITFKKLELNNSEKLFAYPILCKILIQNDKWQEIQQITDEMLMINPNNFEAQGLLAQSLFKQGKFMESYIILDQMINQFNDIDEFDMMMKQKRLTSFLNFFQDNKHQDEHLIEDAKEILERDPQSFMANFILSDYKLWIDNVEMLYKKYPNNKCFQWSYFYFLLQQENYKGIIKLNTQSIFPLFIIAPYLQDEIRDNMDDKNTIEYLDKLNPNEPQNRLFEIIKSIILIETGNQQESFEQLQKILSFDEVIREYVLTVLFYKMEIFKIFINRFLETKTKRQIEQMIKQKLDIDPENLAVWFLNTYVKLYE